MTQNPPLEITPAEVKQRLDRGERLFLIDVRELAEFAQARIAGAELAPLGSVPSMLAELENKAEEAPLIVICHHGVRSLQAVHFLRERGVQACQSMSGGIDRWSREIDPAVPRYF